MALPPPQVSIRCFAGVALERDGVPVAGRATQRRRLALLLLLVGSHRQPVSRDRLTAYLWPESDSEGGRHLLSGAIYELRRVLGEDAILSRGDDVWLNNRVVQCDVAAFEEAIERGNPDDAIALYRGPFADGFHVSGAAEFERWLDDKRDHYRRAFRKALETRATRLSEAGDPRAAADTWLRSAAEDPADARVLLAAMRALDASGNRAAALKQASIYEAFVRAEFGAQPAQEVVDFAQSLRRAAVMAAPTPPDQGAVVSPHDGSRGRPRLLGRALWVGGAAGVALIALLAGRFARGGAAAPDPAAVAAVRVMVLPFASRAGLAASQSGIEFSDLLGAGLDGAGNVRAVAADSVLSWTARGGADSVNARAAAARLGAHAYVTGTIHEGPGVVRVRAELHWMDAARAPVSVAAEARADKPFVVIDTLAMQLIAELHSAPADRLSRVAARSTRSLAALRAYLSGEQDRRAGRFALAAESFGKAVKADSSFALAHYRLSMMTLAADLPWAEAVNADTNARRHSVRLADRDRLLLRAYRAFRRGDAESAEQIYRGLLATYPDDLEAWRQLGETLFHYNPLRGRPIREARAAFARVLADQPDDWEALWHMGQLDALEGRTAEARKVFERLLSLSPAPRQSLELRALLAVISRDAQSEAALAPELRRADELFLHQIVWRCAVYLRDLGAAERLARLLTESSRPNRARRVGHLDLAALYLAQGKWRAAQAELRATTGGQRLWDGEVWDFRAHAAAFAVPARPREELAELRDSLRAVAVTEHGDPALWQMFEGILSVRIGDTLAASRTLAHLDRTAAAESPTMPERALVGEQVEHPYFAGHTSSMRAATVRAALAQSRGDAAAMIGASQVTYAVPWFGFALSSIAQSRTMERFAHAEGLRAAGQHQRAVDMYASFAEHSIYDVSVLGQSHLRRGEIYEKRGDRRLAAQHYERLIELWRDCDPELRPLREAARARLAALRAL